MLEAAGAGGSGRRGAGGQQSEKSAEGCVAHGFSCRDLNTSGRDGHGDGRERLSSGPDRGARVHIWQLLRGKATLPWQAPQYRPSMLANIE